MAENFEIPSETLYFEIDFDTIFALKEAEEKTFGAISPYQSIRRELNFVLPRTAETGKVANKIASVHPWISNVIVDSVFEDAEKVGKDVKSVNFSFIVQSPDSTISDDEAQKIQQSVIEAVEKMGYKLRGF